MDIKVASPAREKPASDGLHFPVVVVGGGAAGIAAATSLLNRHAGLRIAVVEPADAHYYQPGWTMVGAGLFTAGETMQTMARVMPSGVSWLKGAVCAFEPDANRVLLEDGKVLRYDQLIVCPGLKLDWDAIPGLVATLGQNGVTSNYRYDLAPYTWELVKNWRGGEAHFTQPPMPIKCAGAPQKALYLSCDTWRRSNLLGQTKVSFFNAGGALFGVPAYVPALMEYIKTYSVNLQFGCNLTSIDGPNHRATFTKAGVGGDGSTFSQTFDLIHVVPPQVAPDFIRSSPLADATGWVDVDQATLRHKRFTNVFGLGDVSSTTNAKTAAAARKQAPVVAHNILAALGKAEGTATYDGYGSCPLTVERGKIVLAEFLYGGKVAPSFPAWFIDGTKPSRTAWILKRYVLPKIYWNGMLKGREWMASPVVAGK
jgi:sulfide:quinone oxidoreductase